MVYSAPDFDIQPPRKDPIEFFNADNSGKMENISIHSSQFSHFFNPYISLFQL